MSETGEIPNSQVPEKKMVADRVRAALYTLCANPGLQRDATLSTAGVTAGLTYDKFLRRNALIEWYNENIFSKASIPNGTTSVVIGLIGTSFGLFGFPSFNAKSEEPMTQNPKDAMKKLAKATYNNSLIPQLIKAWRTGVLQLTDETLGDA
jgi:hypothetical protein